MLAKAGEIARNGIFGHLPRLFHSFSICNAPWQSRNQRGIAALRLRSKHDVVVVAGLGHWSDSIVRGKAGQTGLLTTALLIFRLLDCNHIERLA
jgi:hypothetical protein